MTKLWKTANVALTQAADPRNRRRTAKPEDRLEEARKVLFEMIKVRGPDGVTEMTRLKAYMQKLQRDALEGDINAILEMKYIAKHLEMLGILAEPPRKSQDSITKLISDHQKVSSLDGKILAMAYAKVCDRLQADFVARRGREPDFPFEEPYYLDLEECEKARLWVQTRKNTMRTRVIGSEAVSLEEVGYKKPPASTRWKAKQSGNPSGKRKERVDGWDDFRAIHSQPVPVQAAGRQIRMNSDAVITRRVCTLAMKGEKKARRLLRQTLIELDQKRMMTPPLVRRRRRTSAAMRAKTAKIMPTMQVTMALAELSVMEHMAETFSRVYGPNPTFRQDIERKRGLFLAQLSSVLAVKKEPA